MRYYDLDVNGWPRGSYSRPQPDKELQHLTDQPSEHHRWDGSQWIEDAASIAAGWYERIQSRADTELQRGIAVTIDGVTYGIRTGSTALALIGGGAITAEKARRAVTTVTEKVPTDKGIVAFDQDGLDAIFEATRAHRAAIMDRVEVLQAKVADGTITAADLEQWP